MKIYFDDAVARDHRARVEVTVREMLGGRARRGGLAVSIGRYGAKRWSVFVAGSLEHPLPLVESIRAALQREPM